MSIRADRTGNIQFYKLGSLDFLPTIVTTLHATHVLIHGFVWCDGALAE